MLGPTWADASVCSDVVPTIKAARFPLVDQLEQSAKVFWFGSAVDHHRQRHRTAWQLLIANVAEKITIRPIAIAETGNSCAAQPRLNHLTHRLDFPRTMWNRIKNLRRHPSADDFRP